MIHKMSLFKEAVNNIEGLKHIIKSSYNKQSTSLPVLKNTQIIRKFVIYQNQRWWIIKGWTGYLFPSDIYEFSDCTGKIKLDKDEFKLPSEKWIWMENWTPEVNDKTDSEGWMYSTDFDSMY